MDARKRAEVEWLLANARNRAADALNSAQMTKTSIDVALAWNQKAERETKETLSGIDELAALLARDDSEPEPEPTPEPEPEPQPTPAPQPEPNALAIITSHNGTIELRGEGDGDTNLTLNGKEVFVRATVIVAGGVRLSVVTFSHSYLVPQSQRGPASLAAIGVTTEGGAEMIGQDEDAFIPPAQSLTVWGYEATDGYINNPEQWALRLNFWNAYAFDVLPVAGFDRDVIPQEYTKILDQELDQLMRSAPTVGPYRVAWDAEGYGHGGQGIEPDAMDWRKTPAGLALAFEVAMSTMNRMQFCITDADGAPNFDPDAAYTTTHNAKLPPEYDWNPHDPDLPAYAPRLADYNRIDGQHFARVYRDLVFLAQMCPDFTPARRALRVVAKWLAACSIATGFDSGHASNPHYWSLDRKLEEIRKTPGVPSKFCNRAAVHEARCAFEFLRLYDDFTVRDPQTIFEVGSNHHAVAQMRHILSTYVEMFTTAANANGVSYGEPASIVDHAPRSWGNALAAQPRELRLALLLFDDILDSVYMKRAIRARVFDSQSSEAMRVAGHRLSRYLGTNAGAAINLETGEKAGNEHWGFPLATHGVVPETVAKLRADAASRSTEAGGSQPLNYDRQNVLGIPVRQKETETR